MKNKCLGLFTALLTLLATSSVVFSQKIEWGELNKAKSKNYYPTIVGEDNQSIYTFSTLKSDYIIERYDKNQKKQQYAKVIDPPKINGNRVEVERVNFVNGKFIVFASYFDKKASESVIYAFTINGADGKVLDKNIALFNIPVEKKRRDGEFYVFISEDKTKILLNHNAYYKKQKQFKDKYKLIDADLNVLVEREDAVNKESKDYFCTNYVIDNDGSFYFLKHNNGDGKKFIVSYNANKKYEKWEEYLDLSDLGLKSKEQITDVIFTVNKQNDIVVSGYYANEKDIMEGCFFMKISSASKEIEMAKVNVFEKSFKDQFLTKRQEKKGKEAKIGNRFKSISITTKKDGGIVLIGESYVHTVYQKNGNTVAEVQHFGDLVVLNLSPAGALSWANRIPKSQIYSVNTSMYPFVYGSWGVSLFAYPTRIPEYFSYLSGISNDKLFVLFNDNPKNTLTSSDKDKTKPLRKLGKSAVTLYTLDLKTGQKTESLFTGAKDFDVILKPGVSFQKDQGSEIISFGMKGKTYKYGVLKVN